jgi:pentapeptide MXKDX repeat protein
MKSAFAVLTLTALVATGAIALTGCNSSTATTDKMQSSSTGMEGKVMSDKMTGDKMTPDTMSTDKMTEGKMTGDKMGTDKMTGDKMSMDKMGK